MSLKNYKKEELETMTFTDLAEIILNEKGSAMKIVDIFKKICKVLGLSDQEFENKVADFYELISTDKNFIILDKGKCDLQKKHDFKVVVEEDDDDTSEDIIIDEEETPTEEDEDIFYDNSSDEDDIEDSDDEDELRDFIVVDDDEEASM